jgi:acyl dehydratase
MPINLDMIGKKIEIAPFVYDQDDVIFYALSVGAGVAEMDFIYEKNLKVLPTFAILPFMSAIREFKQQIGSHNFHTLQLGHELKLYRSLPTAGRFFSTVALNNAYDKGDKGAILFIDVDSVDEDGRPFFSNRIIALDRKGGDFGGNPGPSVKRPNLPVDRPADFRAEQQTSPEQAALYRLNGDKHPMHIDPEYSRIHGFERPILHGLCACAFVIRVVLQKFCDGDPNRFESFSCRFSKPCFPGDLFQTRGWQTKANELQLQTATLDGRVVLDNFVVQLADQPLP